MSDLETRTQTEPAYRAEKGSQNPLFERFYTQAGQNIYDSFEYEKRTSQISDKNGKPIFIQNDVEVPKEWSDTALNIAASKYFRRKDVKPEYGGNETGGEQSVKRMVHRVSHTLRTFGEQRDYFTSKEEAEIFEDELAHILLSQKAAFNSPVWFNVGLFHDYGIVQEGQGYYWDPETNTIKLSSDAYSHPQGSACFINSVQDTMFGDHSENDHSIFSLIETEARLFKYGSGTGTNFSNIRAVGEPLSGGGESSGLMTFLKIPDMGANAVKSGGITRRAAKMVSLDSDHPEIKDFAYWKVDSERKARALAGYGFDPDMDAVYRELSGQNSNNSVRLPDGFLKAVEENGDWPLIERKTGKVRTVVKARDLMEYFAKCAWVSGDPGVQFHTTINNWHTCSGTDEIRASNPCSEYMFLDDTACNLASINLMRFRREDGTFDIESFRHTVRIMTSAQELVVDLAGYPTPSIARNSHDYRPLGLGHVNLGAFLMSEAMPYDSDEGRAVAGAITSVMTGEAYRQSAIIASKMGPYAGFGKNRESHLKVMRQHQASNDKIQRLSSGINLEEIIETGARVWEEAVTLTEKYGSRNAQASVEAPTGTIGFLMDCDTTGIEPDFALVKRKNMVGGGKMKLVNKTVPLALRTLGYSEEQIKEIHHYLTENGTINGAPYIKEADLPVFDVSVGEREISPMGHVKMMGAIQPFISGAISKTVNMPRNWTARDVYDIYMEAWKAGVKAVALYRDGAKLSQPLSALMRAKPTETLERGQERPLPQRADSYTIRVKIRDEHNIEQGLHIICGEYEDGTLGEVRAQMHEEGSTVQGLLNDLTISWSKELRFGVPLEDMVARNRKPKYSPSGTSDYPYMRSFNSLPHLVWGIVGLEYLGPDKFADVTGEDSFRQRVKHPEKLRVNKNKERIRFEYYMGQIRKIDSVMNTPLFDEKKEVPAQATNGNGNGGGELQIVPIGTNPSNSKNDDKKKVSNGATCPGCGVSLPGIPGCSHCDNCGKQVGGGCPS